MLYSNLDIEYNQAFSGPYQDVGSEHSVAGLKGGEITGFWRPCIVTGDHKKEIRRLWDISRRITYLETDPVTEAGKWLLLHGYQAEPVYQHCIYMSDLKWSDVRKSYQSLINADLADCWISSDVMRYKKLHEELSGRRTRPPQTWKIQQKMADEGYGFVVVLRDWEGAVFVMHDESQAYYASAKCRSNSHAIVWAAILETRARGIRKFVMGDVLFSGDPKAVNISTFKRGFGGYIKLQLLLRHK